MELGIDKNLTIDFSENEANESTDIDYGERNPMTVMFLDEDNETITEEEEVTLEITEQDVYIALINIFSKNPAILKSIRTNYSAIKMTIDNELSEFFGADLTLSDLIETFPKIQDFVYLSSIGVLVHNKYINAVPSDVKLYVETPNDKDSIYIRTTSIGRVFKSIPVISFFVKAEFNSLMAKFFKGKFPSGVNGDYYNYYISQFQEAETQRKIQDINIDIEVMTDLEIVSWIDECGGLTEEVYTTFKLSNFPQRRLDKIKKIITLMEMN